MKISTKQITKESIVNPNLIPSLDGLRAVAIIIVMLAHFNNHWHVLLLSKLVNAGIVGVYIFFVLSGFLITTLLDKEKLKTNKINLSKFYVRRILRIVPLSWLFIVIIILISLVLKTSPIRQNFWIPGLYLANITGIGSISYIFLHYWSLSAEEQYYIFIPPLLKLQKNYFKLLLILILLLTFIFRFLALRYHLFLIHLFYDLTRNLDGLIIGSLLAIFYLEKKIPIKHLMKYKWWINIIGLPLLLILNHESSNLFIKIFANHTFYALIIGLLIVINIQPSNDIFYRFLNHKYLVKIGIISYSLYIWQQLFSSGIIPLPMFVNFILVFFTAYFSYYYFEIPFLNLKKKFNVI